jgi:hypothetical protein
MRNYDYLHSGIVPGDEGIPGVKYDVTATKQKLKGFVDNWRATKQTIENEDGVSFRLYVRDSGESAYFSRDDMLKRVYP